MQQECSSSFNRTSQQTTAFTSQQLYPYKKPLFVFVSVAISQKVLYPDGESPSYVEYKINSSRDGLQVHVKFGENLGFIPGNRSWNFHPEHRYIEGMLISREGYDELLVHVENGYEVIVNVRITQYCRNGGCCIPMYTVNPVHFPVAKLQFSPCQFSSGSGMALDSLDNNTAVGDGATSSHPTFPVAMAIIATPMCWYFA